MKSLKRFADCMRLGATMTEQSFGCLHWRRGNIRKTCALGSALVGAGYSKVLDSAVDREFPELYAVTYVYCPLCYEKHFNGKSMVMHLNDVHKWTRNQIADWLDPKGVINKEKENVDLRESTTCSVG